MKAKSLVKLTSAAVVVVAVVGVGGYYAAQWYAKRAVTQALASLPPDISGKAGDTHYNPISRVLTIDKLTFTRGGQPWLDVDQLVLTDPQGRGTDADPWQAKAVGIAEIAGHVPELPSHVAKITSQDVTAFADPTGSTPFAAATGLRVKNATAIKIDAFTGQQGSVQLVELKGLSDGRLAALNAEQLTVPDGHTELHIAKVGFSDLDIDSLITLFMGYGKDDASAASRKLAGHAMLEGLTDGPNGKTDYRIASIEAADVSAPAAAPNCGEDVGCVISYFGKLDLGLFEVKGVDLARPSNADCGDDQAACDQGVAKDGKLQLGALRLDKYKTGKFDSLTMDDAAYADAFSDTGVGFRHLAVTNGDLTEVIRAQEKRAPGEQLPSRLGQTRMATAVVDGASFKPEASEPPILLDHLETANTYGADGDIRTVSKLSGLTIDIPEGDSLEDDLAPMARELVGTQAKFAGDIDYTYSPTKQTLNLERLHLSLNDLGSLTLSTRLEDVNFDDLESLEQSDSNPVIAGLSFIQRTKLVDGSLRFDNGNMVERMLGYAAKDSQTTVEQVKDLAHESLKYLADELPWQADAEAQLDAFLDQPKALTVTIHPNDATTLSDLVGQMFSIDLEPLQLKIIAND